MIFYTPSLKKELDQHGTFSSNMVQTHGGSCELRISLFYKEKSSHYSNIFILIIFLLFADIVNTLIKKNVLYL